MKRSDDETSRYFQAVSRFFFERRGAPFFLSAKEIDNIKEWKSMGIPLQIVREGIEECILAQRTKPGWKSKVQSLSFCRHFVLRGYEAYRERKVGRNQNAAHKEDKRKELKKAVEGFLVSCPARFSEIGLVFSRALKLISQGAAEERLEELEEEVEALALQMASAKEREQIRKKVMNEYGDRSVREREQIYDLKLIKHIRQKYAIPYLSLYYYGS